MPGIKGLYLIKFGKETTLGTEANATSYWRGQGTIKDESNPVYPEEDVGIIGRAGRLYLPKEDATIDLPEIEGTFEQLPYLLNMGVKGVAGSQDGIGSGYIYSYPLPYDAVQSPYTYTFELGDNQQAELVTGCFAEEITIKGVVEEAWKMQATLRGWPQGPGSFTTSISLPTVEEVKFGNTQLYIDDVGDGFGTTPLTESFLSFELTISKIFKAQWTGDGAGLNYVFLKVNSGYEVTLKFTLEHDATAVAERANRRALTPRAIRVLATGSTLTTAGTTYSKKTAILDICGTYSEPEALDEDDGNMVLPFVLKNHYDATLAERGSMVVVNELSALP